MREGKDDKDRVVFLGNAGRRILWRYLTTRPAAKQEDYLFPAKTNRRLDRNNLRETIQRVAERAAVATAFPTRAPVSPLAPLPASRVAYTR